MPGISGVDTRALTRRLRVAGVMMGALVQDEPPEDALARLRDSTRYGSVDLVPDRERRAAVRLAAGGRLRAADGRARRRTASSSSTSA